MFNLWKKKPQPNNDDNGATPNSATPSSGELVWDEQARMGLQQALAQAPVPAMLKGKVKKELKKAAEEYTLAAGRTTVTAEDLMNGMLSKLPSNMRGQVEEAMKGGPEKLEELQRKLKK